MSKSMETCPVCEEEWWDCKRCDSGPFCGCGPCDCLYTSMRFGSPREPFLPIKPPVMGGQPTLCGPKFEDILDARSWVAARDDSREWSVVFYQDILPGELLVAIEA